MALVRGNIPILPNVCFKSIVDTSVIITAFKNISLIG